MANSNSRKVCVNYGQKMVKNMSVLLSLSVEKPSDLNVIREKVYKRILVDQKAELEYRALNNSFTRISFKKISFSQDMMQS